MRRHLRGLVASSVLLACPATTVAHGDPFALLFGEDAVIGASTLTLTMEARNRTDIVIRAIDSGLA